MASMARGSAASLDEVAKAMVAGSVTAERNPRRGTRKNRAEGSSTSKANAINATYNVSNSLPRFRRMPMPICPTVKAIAAPTPMGAKYMTTLVNLNMTSLRLEKKLSMGARFSLLRQASAMPKKIAKTATWRIWPSATDLAMFSGKTCRIESCQRVAAEAGMLSPGDGDADMDN